MVVVVVVVVVRVEGAVAARAKDEDVCPRVHAKSWRMPFTKWNADR
ncbi:hypothetical protein [Myxococcus sp. CA039A]|nr:hypothetical protein [Myxococcus sp. CA039A]NTX51545.1 hypothetical protein [Myxococcus sp. CA039A]